MRTRNYLRPAMSKFFYDDFNSLFDLANKNMSMHKGTVPMVNIKENDDGYTVEMAAPGMKKEDFTIEVDQEMLTIKSEAKEENEETQDNYTKKEFSYHSFQRSFNLNTDMVDDENIQATYKDGILSINIPKKEEVRVKGARLIEISE